jgi:hypothetical protein
VDIVFGCLCSPSFNHGAGIFFKLWNEKANNQGLKKILVHWQDANAGKMLDSELPCLSLFSKFLLHASSSVN